MLTCYLRTSKGIISFLKLSLILCLVVSGFSATAQWQGQLPVNLKTFAARAEGNKQVKVFWTTEYEKDNGYFNIERSTDAVNFTVVGKVPGKNLHGLLTDYFFYDQKPLKGISFYRLKQVDVDEKFSYSPIARVNNADVENIFDIYPNPAPGNEFKIDLLQLVPGIVNLAVTDINGRIVLQKQYNNSHIISVVHNLPAGMYTVKISGTAFKATEKLLLQ